MPALADALTAARCVNDSFSTHELFAPESKSP
jgi:hypothetical protein